jgi:hypothetical protein
MRQISRLLALVGLLLLGAQAQGAQLTIPATLTIYIVGLPRLSISSVPLIGVSTTGNHVDALTIPSSAFQVAGKELTATSRAPGLVKGVEFTVRNLAGAFNGAPLGGAMPLIGIAKVCVLRVCSNATANVSVPISVVGVGGFNTATGSISVTVGGAPWTAGRATERASSRPTITQMGFQHGPASATSSTALHSGVIRLVTPIFISTSLPSLAIVPAFGYLDLHFAPEPSTLVLLGGGIVGLVLVGHTKRA